MIQTGVTPLPQTSHAPTGRVSAQDDPVFLMLQGPHGPFFDRLGRLLRAAGAVVWRCGFNGGDEFFWSDKARLLRHQGSSAEWPVHLLKIIA